MYNNGCNNWSGCGCGCGSRTVSWSTDRCVYNNGTAWTSIRCSCGCRCND